MTTCLFSDCTAPATGRDDYPWACWRHTPDDEDRYPVIVEYTYRHVVWVAAGSAEHAARAIESDAYEYTDDSKTLVEAGWSVNAPKPWDRHTVYSDCGDGEYTTQADAHVQAYRHEQWRVQRVAEVAACVAAGHPKTQTYSHGTFCAVCGKLREVTP